MDNSRLSNSTFECDQFCSLLSIKSSLEQNSTKQILTNRQQVFKLKQVIRTQKQPCLQQKLLKFSLLNNRKEKSLQELSKRFLNIFYKQKMTTIQLDKISLELGVQKRRIYDLINILQSLKIVQKAAKNNYKWCGVQTIAKTIENYSLNEDYKSIQSTKIRKSKSLEILSIGFLCLFLHWKPKLTLDEAAKKLVGQMESSKVKTKIRRLYDIANVYKSLGIIRKTTLYNKKSGFEWLGLKGFQMQSSSMNSKNTYSINKQKQILLLEKDRIQQKTKIQQKFQFSSFFAEYLSQSLHQLLDLNKTQNFYKLVDKTEYSQCFMLNLNMNLLISFDVCHNDTLEVCHNWSNTVKGDKYGFKKTDIPF